LRLADFDYPLPPERIAQAPLDDRAASRMLVVDRKRLRWEDRGFRDFPSFIKPGDCLVLNDSKVFPGRLFGHRSGFSGRVEVLLLGPASADRRSWRALVHPGRKVRTGERIEFDGALVAEVIGRGGQGERLLRFLSPGDPSEVIERIGHVPLPPYIRRADSAADRDRYQTVYARAPGSAAAPTAGLHFTSGILQQCRAAGAELAMVTLDVGLGTFQPLRSEDQRTLDSEPYLIGAASLSRIRAANRVVAVGTTSARTIETFAATGAGSGDTDLFIRPGFSFRLTGALLTNFHLPRSSLLLLVCAFGGKDLVMAAYRHAVESGYRFYSYGDCMLLI